jgi:uncharacterized protein
LKRNITIFILFVFITLLLVPIVMAKQKEMKGHMYLLAVSENSEMGSLADLYLEIKPGNGNIYIDTFPLTKMDTQLSTRFAKEIACKFLDKDCNKFDFFYTIKAGSSIIGGPSAGAASAMLTVALLDKDVTNIDESVTITGTINTGGIIGSVGGVKAKIEAAAASGMKKVLVPIGSSFELNETKFNNTITDFFEVLNSSSDGSSNMSDDTTIVIDTLNITEQNVSDKVNLEEFGKSLGIEVIEVLTLGDALNEFTGKVYETVDGEIELEEFYTKTMDKIGNGICVRSEELLNQLNKTIIEGKGVMDEEELLNNVDFNKSMTLLETSEAAIELGQSYAAASYCFGANINFDYLILLNVNLTEEEKAEKMQELYVAINNSNNIIDNMGLVSFNDLQTYMIVKDRLSEASDVWNEANKAFNDNKTTEHDSSNTEYNLAYVTERLFSAYSWSYFFNTTQDEFIMDDEIIGNSCKIIISEAQERLEYFRLLYPYPLPLLESTSKEIDKALDNFNKNKTKVCLMHATKAKSEIDAVLGTINLEDEELKRLLDAKLSLVQQVILEQQLNGLFPIQGYSYYEYAKSLGQEDLVSGLIYSQYALEFSNLDLYFQRVKKEEFTDVFLEFTSDYVYVDTIIAFSIGFLSASIIFFVFGFFIHRKEQNKAKKPKKKSRIKKKSK